MGFVAFSSTDEYMNSLGEVAVSSSLYVSLGYCRLYVDGQDFIKDSNHLTLYLQPMFKSFVSVRERPFDFPKSNRHHLYGCVLDACPNLLAGLVVCFEIHLWTTQNKGAATFYRCPSLVLISQ